MPTYPNAGYNNPALGQALGNIASLFAPPSPQEALVAQTLQQQRAQAAQTAAARAQLSPHMQQLADLYGFDPVKMAAGAQLQLADSGAPIGAQSPYGYARDGQFGNTPDAKVMTPLSQGQSMTVPAGVAGPLKLPAPDKPGQPTTITNEAADPTPSTDALTAKIVGGLDPAAQQKWALARGQGGAPQTVINNGASESSEAAARGKAAADGFNTMQTQAAAAPGNISRLKLLNTVLQKTQTGPLSGATGTVVGLANQLGISPDTIKGMGLDPNQAVDNSIAGKLAGELVMGSIGAKNGGFPASNFSVAERQFIENTFPNLQAQPGANQAVTDVLTAVQQRALDKSAAYQQYATQQKAAGKYPDYEGFDQAFQQAHAQDDVFSPIAQKFANGGYSPPGAGAPQPASNAPSPYGAAPAPMQPPGGGLISPFNVNGPVGGTAAPAPGAGAPPVPSITTAIPPAAAQFLKANPGMRAAFEQKYGQGTAASVLGQ